MSRLDDLIASNPFCCLHPEICPKHLLDECPLFLTGLLVITVNNIINSVVNTMINDSALGNKSKIIFSVSGWFSNVLESTGRVTVLDDVIVLNDELMQS